MNTAKNVQKNLVFCSKCDTYDKKWIRLTKKMKYGPKSNSTVSTLFLPLIKKNFQLKYKTSNFDRTKPAVCPFYHVVFPNNAT